VLKYRFTQVLGLLTFALLILGGLVTSTDSGLAVPDWPLSFGGLFPPMVGGIRYEHTHRVVAAAVGVLTFLLTIWIGKTESRPGIRWLAITSLGVVVLQGILGGLAVLFRLPPPVSVAHACLGPVFFCLVTLLASMHSPGWQEAQNGFSSEREEKRFQLFSGLTVLAAFLQIILGAIVRHTGVFVWIHVSWAFVVLTLTGFLVVHSLAHLGDERFVLWPALFLGFLVTVEFFLGIGAFVFTRIPGIPPGAGHTIFPTVHQALGSLILATAVVLALRSRRATSLVSV